MDKITIYDLVSGSYDDQIGPTSRREWAKGIIALLQHVHLNRGLVIDIGCGTGSGAEMLSRVGDFTIDGVDGSIPMLNIAKRKNLYRNIFTEIFPPLSCDNEMYDLACCGFDTLNCLPPEQHAEFLNSVRNRLKPGGWFVFDALIPSEREQTTARETTSIHETTHESPRLHMVTAYAETFCTIRVTVETAHGSVSAAQEKLAYASEAGLILLLQKSGFIVENQKKFSLDSAAPPSKLALLCRRG
ncbi:MAG: class I SAM-dependent methyltransferase [Gammaproteobacteria bacterium]|nr:class I SAM-dependent methyltransferase [Gammaproteobacteria bacterium]